MINVIQLKTYGLVVVTICTVPIKLHQMHILQLCSRPKYLQRLKIGKKTSIEDKNFRQNEKKHGG